MTTRAPVNVANLQFSHLHRLQLPLSHAKSLRAIDTTL
jgi:hypothetical protein